MGMTMTQKILAAHAGLPQVTAGQLIEAKLDLCLGNDITSPVAIKEFERCGACQVFDKSRVALVHGPLHPQQGYQGRRAGQADVREFAGQVRYRAISLTWAAWASSMPCCPSRGWWAPVTASSAPIATPVPTARWALSPPAWVPPIWRQAWPPARRGSRCRPPSRSMLTGKLSPYVGGKDVILHLIG